MNATTTHRDLAAILADLADFTVASSGTIAAGLYHELEDAVRAQLAPLPEGEAERMDAEAEADARTMAPPVPGVTQNAGFTVRAVIQAHGAVQGLLAAWWVACENTETGAWVTWNAYAQDGTQAGRLSYDGGHYFDVTSGPSGLGRADNKQRAMADLAVRAGTMPQMALRIADEIISQPGSSAEDRRITRRLRAYFTR